MMLSYLPDLLNDYEIIPQESFGTNSNCQKSCCYTKVSTPRVKDLIRPNERLRDKDRRVEKIITSVSEVRDFVVSAKKDLGFEYLEVEDQLQSIAYMIMRRFSLNKLNCRMDLIYSDKCKSFHVDSVYLRSITTLVGPGTELQLSKESNHIRQVKTGDTLLIKGSHFPGGNINALHRSPKISHLGKKRLIFVMDY
ncbi:MAG: DUF1826 domain-containing protein [Lentisphaeraceae bacterium]|nr:DUF1826 domain-containing protein [Lentisphaeraceae bacterium]